MADKKKFVVVLKNSCKVLINPSQDTIDAYNNQGFNTYEDPDLSKVANYPPEYWKVEHGVFVPCTEDEGKKRDALRCFKKHVKIDTVEQENLPTPAWVHWMWCALSIGAAIAVYKIWR